MIDCQTTQFLTGLLKMFMAVISGFIQSYRPGNLLNLKLSISVFWKVPKKALVLEKLRKIYIKWSVTVKKNAVWSSRKGTVPFHESILRLFGVINFSTFTGIANTAATTDRCVLLAVLWNYLHAICKYCTWTILTSVLSKLWNLVVSFFVCGMFVWALRYLNTGLGWWVAAAL